ncbi:replication initiator [Microbispora siamensis]
MNEEANPASTNGPDAHPEWLTDMVRVLNDPGYERWRSMVAATGGCSHPVHLAGESHVIDAATGEVLHSYRTADEPSGHLLVACGNRRASVCPACSEVYRADTYQLIRTGLSGGKGVPQQVSEHPRVFATLTAPSFGPVHTLRERNGKTLRCRPRKNARTCPHGNPVGCPEIHGTGDQLLGQPICPQCYDYPGAVLWQAHAGLLWHRFTVKAAEGSRMYAYIVLSLLTGARTEELRALTWDHVDMEGDPNANPPVPPHVAVWRSVRAGGDTKTRKSRRTLALSMRCLDALQRQREQQEREREAAGEKWQENNLVFASKVGTPLDPSHVRRDFRNAIKDAEGVNPAEWTPRELRHSFVSLLSDNGLPLEEISRLVGHSSTATTEAVYRKQIRPVLETGARAMDRIFDREEGRSSD